MAISSDSLVAATRAIALPDIVGIEDLAQHTGLSPATLRKLMRLGALPGRKLAGRWFVSREALLRSLAEQEGPHVA